MLRIAVYNIITITLSTLLIHKVRPIIYKCLKLPPMKKMRWQTVLGVFLLHIFMIVITIFVLPYFHSNEDFALQLCSYLSLAFVLIYTAWYFTNSKVYAGVDFMLILTPIALLYLLLFNNSISLELYYTAWCNIAYGTYYSFFSICLCAVCMFDLTYKSFPKTRETIKQLWNGGNHNVK